MAVKVLQNCFLFLWCFLFICNTRAFRPDFAAVLTIASSLGLPQSFAISWSLSGGPCIWLGISCNTTSDDSEVPRAPLSDPGFSTRVLHVCRNDIEVEGRHCVLKRPLEDSNVADSPGEKFDVYLSMEVLGIFSKKKRYWKRLLAGPSPKSSSMSNNAPASAPEPRAVELANHSKTTKKAAVVRWLTGLTIGLTTGALSAVVVSLVIRISLFHSRVKRFGQPRCFHRSINLRALAFLQKDDGLQGLEAVGKGGCGEVFRATLENKKVVAIKKVVHSAFPLENEDERVLATEDGTAEDLTKKSKQIHAEIETLGNARHINLLMLLAYVPRCNGDLLVYEYMPNGSLHDAIVRVAEGTLDLTWPMRHAIALGTAAALKYLHFDCSPRILHGDLKPGNILLNSNFQARVGDFGLATLLPDSFSHVTMSNFAGTVGYIAPEIFQTLRYTTACDIYSFGVVLVVIITGKEPTDGLFSEVLTHMGAWVSDKVAAGKEQALSCFDPTILGRGYDEQMFSALKIAAFCLAHTPGDRPSSKDVLNMLEKVHKIQLSKPTWEQEQG